MRDTIEDLLNYIDSFSVCGRDDFEIGTLYACISSLYAAIDSVRVIESRNSKE